jgi:hypothetical protein
MQTLAEFRKNWTPVVLKHAKDIGDNFEAGRNMSQYTIIEAQLRSEVDALALEYAESLAFAPKNQQEGYLLSLRLTEGALFAQFLEHCGFGLQEKTAREWIEFFVVDAWNEYLVNKWRTEFLKAYGPPSQS